MSVFEELNKLFQKTNDEIRKEKKKDMKSLPGWYGLDTPHAGSAGISEGVMSFPKNEYNNIKHRFDNNLNVVTHRFSDEAKKYKLGDVVESDFGKLKIIKFEELDDLYDDNTLKGDDEFEKFKDELKGKSGVKITIKKLNLREKK